MKSGAENRKKTIAAGALGAGALVCLFIIYNTFFSGPDTPPATPTATATRATVPTSGLANSRASSSNPQNVPGGPAPGVGAQKLATASSSLDPTLDEAAMLRTESLVYTGSGRNIFSTTYTLPAASLAPLKLPKVNPRPGPALPPPPPPPPQTCPPACPPIPLKFFGTATRANGVRQAFLLSGEDVYLASQGDIVARKYKIVQIGSNTLQVTDLTNNYTQTLPLQMN